MVHFEIFYLVVLEMKVVVNVPSREVVRTVPFASQVVLRYLVSSRQWSSWKRITPSPPSPPPSPPRSLLSCVSPTGRWVHPGGRSGPFLALGWGELFLRLLVVGIGGGGLQLGSDSLGWRVKGRRKRVGGRKKNSELPKQSKTKKDRSLFAFMSVRCFFLFCY